MVVSVRPGYKDITDWREVRFWHGASYVRINRRDGMSVATTMREWRPREEKARTPCEIYIRPEKAEAYSLRDSFKEIKDCQASFAKMTDVELGEMWRIRNAGDRDSRVKYRKMLHLECEKRFDTVLRPVEVTLPYIKELDAQKVKEKLQERIGQQPWPQLIKDWHCAKLRIKTTGQPSIGDILGNVTRPSKIGTRCVCDEVCARMSGLPKTHGHIFFVGRDITDPRTFDIRAQNIPRPQALEAFRAWARVARPRGCGAGGPAPGAFSMAPRSPPRPRPGARAPSMPSTGTPLRAWSNHAGCPPGLDVRAGSCDAWLLPLACVRCCAGDGFRPASAPA